MPDMQVLGLKELDAMLGRLPQAAAKRIVRKAVKRGAAGVRKAARTNARAMVGGAMGHAISKSIATGSGKAVRGGFSVRVGPRSEDNERFATVSAAGRRNYIPAALEYGHDNAPAVPFFRKAWDATREQAVDVIASEMWAGLRAEAAKG